MLGKCSKYVVGMAGGRTVVPHFDHDPCGPRAGDGQLVDGETEPCRGN